MTQTITTIAALVAILSRATSCKGQYATVTASTPIDLYKREGGSRSKTAEAIDPNFCPRSEFKVKWHLGEDYERAMSAALGTTYKKGADSNRETIYGGILMRYKSTNNVCLIYLKGDREYLGTTLNGKALTEEEEAYLARFRKTNNGAGNPVDYRTLSVVNIKRIAFGGEVYDVAINTTPIAEAV